MKAKIQILFLLLILLAFTNALSGQEKKNSVNVSGLITHYFKIEDLGVDTYPGYYKFPLSPGLEITYFREIFSRFEIGTGINFQRVHVGSYVNFNLEDGYTLRWRYNEFSIPLLFKKSFSLKNQNQINFTFGIYSGKQTNIISEYPQSSGWTDWKNIKTMAGYSDDNLFFDIYFAPGYLKLLKGNSGINIAPFFSYRVNQTWLNFYQKSLHYGIKLAYSFKL